MAIYTTAIAADGDAVVVGTSGALVRLRGNGTMDLDFTASVYTTNYNGYRLIAVIKKDGQGRWLIGGDFNVVNDSPRSGIARLLANGQLDSTFLSSAEPPLSNVFIRAIVPAPDGKILVTGYTPSTNKPQSFVARLNENGSIDPAFSIAWADDLIHTLDLQADGKVIAGGRFTTMKGATRNQLARISANGSLDETFDPPRQLREVNGVTALEDGKILAYWSPVLYAEEFDWAGTKYPMVRFNNDGSVDKTFSNGIVCVADVAVQPDGKYILAGKFLSATDANRYFMRIFPDGAPDPTFTVVAENDPRFYYSGSDSKVELDSQNRPLIAGSFTNVNGALGQIARLVNDSGPCVASFSFPTNRFVFVETNGAVSIPVLRRGALDSTSSVEVVSAPLYYVNLPFKTNLVFGPGVTERIALLPLTNDTRIDARRTLQVHLTNQAPTAVLGAPRLAELSILDASSQQFPGALDPNYFVKLDFLPNLFAYPGPIVVMPDGKLVIASGFNTVNGTPSTPVARINTDGSLDSSFHYAGTNQPALIASFGEKVYLASNGGLKPVVRLLANGSEDPAFVAPTFSFEGDPSFRFMTTDTNGNVLIIGSFTNINGFSRSHVARIRPDGSVDPDFNALPAPGVSYRDSIVIYPLPDGTYLLGGAARRVDNEAHPLLTHLSASGSVLGGYEIPDVPMDREWDLWAVVAIVRQSDGSIVIGGNFNLNPGESARKLLRFTPSGILDSTFAPPDNLYVQRLFVQADDKIIVASGGVLRLNKNGSVDDSFKFDEWGYSSVMAVDGDTFYIRSGFQHFSLYAMPGVLRFRAGTYTGPGVIELEAPEEVSLNAASAPVLIRRTAGTSGEARVRLRIRDLSAVSGKDYVATDVVVTFADGEGGAKLVEIPLIKPPGTNYWSQFEVYLTVETAGVALPNYGASQTVAIRSDDSPNGFYMDEDFARWAFENDGRAVITVRRFPAVAQPTTVELVIGAGGDAVPGVDFEAATNRIEFAAGETYQTVLIPLLNDDVIEPDKTLVVKLQNPSEGVIVGSATASISIRDNADEIEFVESTIEAVQENGVARLHVQPVPLNASKPSKSVTIAYKTDGGTAKPGVEYIPQEGEITFHPSYSNPQEILIPLLKNSIVGEPTTIRVTITSVTPEVVITNSAATILLRHPRAVFSPGSPDPNFALNVPYPFWTTSIAVAGGYIYAFQYSNEYWRTPSRLTRYFANGVHDESFQPDGFGTVCRLLSLTSDKLLAVIDDREMRRLNGDGTIDPTFQAALPRFAYISKVLAQADGKLIVAGSVQHSSTVTVFIRRLKVDGSTDSTFASFEFEYHSNSPVIIALQADGKVLVSRKFTIADRAGQQEFVRLTAEGAIDPTFKEPLYVYYPQSIVATPDGKVFVSGWFKDNNASEFAAIVRLNSDGSFDDWVWKASENQPYAALLADEQDRLYLSSGSGSSAPYKLWRIFGNGDVDRTFLADPVGNTIFVMHDALIVASGYGEMTRIFLDSPIAMRAPERLANGGVAHTFSFPANTPYVLEETGDFESWVEVESGVTADGYVRLETAAPGGTRFYRVRSR